MRKRSVFLQVYELDGLQTYPQLIGSFDDATDWLSLVQKALQERIQRSVDDL